MNENNEFDKDEYAAAMNTWQLVKYPFTYIVEFSSGKYDVLIEEITNQQYEYWSNPANEPYLGDMAMGSLNKDDIPDFAMIKDEMCCRESGVFAYANGCAINYFETFKRNSLSIYNEKDERIFEIFLDENTLTNHGIHLHLLDSFSVEDLEPGTCVFSKTICDFADYMQFEIKLHDQSEFELSKLKIEYSIINGISYIQSVLYNDNYLDDVADPVHVWKEGIEFYVHQA